MEKIIHQIWVGPHAIPDREAGFMSAIKEMHPDFQYCLWKNNPRLVAMLSDPVRAVYQQRMNEKAYAFAADILRIAVVYLFGGIYLDVDMEPIIGFGDLRPERADGCFHYNQDNDLTIPNDTIGMKSKHPLMYLCLEDISKGVGDFGPGWLGARAREWCGVDLKAPHNVLGPLLAMRKIDYVYSYADREPYFWEKHFKHHGSYLWSKENQEKMERGLQP